MRKAYIVKNTILITILIVCSSCIRDRFYIFSPDRTKCLTIITVGNIRYVINGKQKSVPDSNFVKLDISSVYKDGDALNVCWGLEGFDWEVIINKAIIIDNKLNNKKFKVSVEIDRDERGIPTEARFRSKDCATICLNKKVLSPDNNGAIIE